MFIHRFYKNHMTTVDRVLVGLIIFGLIAGITLNLLNDVDFHYPTILLFATHITSISWVQAVVITILGFMFLFYGMFIQNASPRASTFIWGAGLFFWCALTNIVLVNGIQSTPFPPIDSWLLKVDQSMGVNTPTLMSWTYHHPDLHHILTTTYNSLIVELLGIPTILTLFSARKSLTIFYIALFSTLYVGCAIYYFFPTMAPSGVLHSPYFSTAQHDTSLRFYDVHHFIHTTITDGGLIAFPSFHVIWAILLTNACRAKKIFFYPVALFNLLLITSTVLLGWHYLTDVIGGAVLAAAGIAFGEWVLRESVVSSQ